MRNQDKFIVGVKGIMNIAAKITNFIDYGVGKFSKEQTNFREKYCVKNSPYSEFSGLFFPAFGLNMEIYSVNLRIQSDCGRIRTTKNSEYGYFLHS